MAQYGTPAYGILGMIEAFDSTIESFVASGAVNPGRPVYSTPGAPGVCHESYASGDYFVGIAMLSHTGTGTGVGVYADKDMVNVMSKGRILVQAGETVTTALVPLYASVTAGATLGKFYLAASTRGAFGAIARGQGVSDGIIEIEVDGPVLVTVA